MCPIIQTAVFLGRQNIPLRGQRDDGLLGGIAPCPLPLYPPLNSIAINTQTLSNLAYKRDIL